MTSFGHLTLILLIHYLVKCRSRSLAVCNNESILDSACIGSEMINWKATNTISNYRISKSHTCHTTSSYSMCSKMFSSSTNASDRRWRHSPTARSITADPEWLTHCWCVISVYRLWS